jgi:hypothetical protein
VDPATVALNNAGVRVVGKRQKLLAHFYDVNRDGFKDLVCYIDLRQLDLEPGESSVILQGNTYYGMAIEGEDVVTGVKPWKSRYRRFIRSTISRNKRK